MGQVRDFLLPDLGEGLESGEIVAWHVDVGDHVDLNEEICDIETAKAVVSVPCPFAGTVVERFGEVGEELEVGEPLLRIDVEEVAADADVAEVGEPVDETTGDRPGEAAGQEQPAGDDVPGGEGGPEGGAEDAAARTEDRHAGDRPGPDQDAQREASGDGDGERHSVLVGYGAAGDRGGGPRRSRRASSSASRRGRDGGGDGGEKPRAKPPVRKLAKDLGIDLHRLAPGSGPDGVITREDVHAAAEGAEREPAARQQAVRSERREGRAEERPAAASAAPEAEPTVTGFRGRSPGDVIPVTGIRRRIVEKMTTSRTEIPEATTEVTVDCTTTWELAARMTAAAADEGRDVRITPFAVVARATVLALRRFPTLNARLDEDAGEIRLLEPIHLGIATDTERGLLVPVVEDAHRRSTLDLGAEIARVVGAARDGSAAPSELTGGTFTVNNYGALGNDRGDPIINHPEAAILGVGAMDLRPWVVDGEIAVRRTVTLTVAFDHRISDGGEAGRFVAYVGELVEDPTRILLHA